MPTMTATPPPKSPFLPPRWVIRSAWIGHRAIHRVTGGRRGLARPTDGGRFGMLRLHTVGRRSGKERVAILGYVEDGRNLVTLAMNGWAAPEPAWWLNLQGHPQAVVDLKGETVPVRARAAVGPERGRLWTLLQEHQGYGTDLAAYARRRATETAVVVLEPRPSA
jgi:deazaflavin-dependent oxidoreductase (nitroreductase family)